MAKEPTIYVVPVDTAVETVRPASMMVEGIPEYSCWLRKGSAVHVYGLGQLSPDGDYGNLMEVLTDAGDVRMCPKDSLVFIRRAYPGQVKGLSSSPFPTLEAFVEDEKQRNAIIDSLLGQPQ